VPWLSVDVDVPGIRGMRKHATQGRATPASLAAGGLAAQRQQPLRHAYERLLLLSVAAKHRLAHRPFRRLTLDPRGITRPIRMPPIAIGWEGPGQQEAGPPLPSTPPAHAFGHQRAFICCHGTAHVPQAVGRRVLTAGLIEKMDLAASARARFQEHHVMPIGASQASGTHHQHTVAGALPALAPPAIAPGAIARGTPRTIVAEDLRTASRLAFTCEMGAEPLALWVDGVGQGWAVGRHPDIEGGGHD